MFFLIVGAMMQRAHVYQGQIPLLSMLFYYWIHCHSYTAYMFQLPVIIPNINLSTIMIITGVRVHFHNSL